MKPPAIHFLPVRTPATQSKRHSELISSEAKAHARRSSHALSQDSKHKPGCRILSPTRTVSRHRSLKHAVVEETEDLRRRPIEDVATNIAPTVEDCGGCAPFIQFPGGVNHVEKQLFHFLMTYCSTTFYGSKPSARFDVLRDSMLPEAMTGELYLSLAVHVAASIMNTLQPGKFSEQWMLARQVRNYQLIRRSVDKSQDHRWDWTLSCLIVAGYADTMAGHAWRGIQHTRAGLRMLGDLRNIQWMRLSSGSIAFKVLLQGGLPDYLSTRSMLDHAVAKVLRSLQMIRSWNSQKAVTSCTLKDCARHTAIGERPVAVADAVNGETCPYWASRSRYLGASSIFCRMLSPDPKVLQPTGERLLVGSIHLLNTILLTLAGNDSTAIDFLRDLDDMAVTSLDSAFDLRNPTRFALQNPIHMIIVCADSHRLWQWKDPNHAFPRLRAWEALEFVEVIMLLRADIRQALIEKMRTCLSEGVTELEDTSASRARTAALQAEIVAGWQAQRKAETRTGCRI